MATLPSFTGLRPAAASMLADREGLVPGDVTRLLNEAADGDREALAGVYPLVFAELQAIAERHMRGERPGHTLQATVLVNEAFVRLVDQAGVDWEGRSHFFAVASEAIRKILISHARRRGRLKRGRGWGRSELHDGMALTGGAAIDLLDLDDALTRLADLSPRQSRVVELRFFGGLSVRQAAEVLGVSPRTVEGEWAIARAWLRRALRGAEPDDA